MIWIANICRLATVLAIHDEQIAEHGGVAGVRDQCALSSALDRPKNIAAYEPADCDARAPRRRLWLWGRQKPPVHGWQQTDGSGRDETFLNLNGLELTADDAACVAAMQALADGTIKEGTLAGWIRDNVIAGDGPRPE